MPISLAPAVQSKLPEKSTLMPSKYQPYRVPAPGNGFKFVLRMSAGVLLTWFG